MNTDDLHVVAKEKIRNIHNWNDLNNMNSSSHWFSQGH
jgi:hypothetical protein